MIKDSVSAVSVGVIDGTPMLDLPYIEDSKAMTDMNVAMTGSGEFIEIQGTAEHRPFNRAELNALLDLAEKGQQGTAGRTAGRARTGLKRPQAERNPTVGWPPQADRRPDTSDACQTHVRQADINEATKGIGT